MCGTMRKLRCARATTLTLTKSTKRGLLESTHRFSCRMAMGGPSTRPRHKFSMTRRLAITRRKKPLTLFWRPNNYAGNERRSEHIQYFGAAGHAADAARPEHCAAAATGYRRGPDFRSHGGQQRAATASWSEAAARSDHWPTAEIFAIRPRHHVV